MDLTGNINVGEFGFEGKTPPGELSFQDIKSALGRLGVRVGTNVTAGNLSLQPFLTASVWHEFEGASISSFNSNSPLPPSTIPTVTSITLSSTRVGTYGQYSAGIAAQLAATGWAGYARVDLRDGSKLEGVSVNGGLRYSIGQDLFGAPALRAPMPTKAPIYKAPPPPAATAFSWTGCYLGAQAGYGWGRSSNDVDSATDPIVDERPHWRLARNRWLGSKLWIPSDRG